jgi:divalent metal cation (Fe/Co/Zn/Cd) transporter
MGRGLVDPSITRSRAGLRVVGASLAVLAVTALIQATVYLATDSIALLADLIHNAGDALTAVPLGAAFLLRSQRARTGRRDRCRVRDPGQRDHRGRVRRRAHLGVVLIAAAVALGAPIAGPLIGLAITALILHITWQSWQTVRGHDHHH